MAKLVELREDQEELGYRLYIFDNLSEDKQM
jgi:hypothetical protein